MYVDHGSNDLNVVDDVLSSFAVHSIGTAKINVQLNGREEPSLSGKASLLVYKGNTSYVYDIKQADGYTWYKIGSHSWIADDESGWVTYIPNEGNGD